MIRRLLGRIAKIGVLLLLGAALAALLLYALIPLPEELLAGPPLSPEIRDLRGRPLLTLAAADGCWRLPAEPDELGPWLAAATVAVEDRRFPVHPGVDGLAVVRAASQNLLSRRVVSGASTLTMQLCRMLDPRPRELSAKVVEAVRALKLERRLGKDEILARYLTLAPYGGNVHGVVAASRIWFGKEPADLSLAEATLLAGLPQSPNGYRPDCHPWRAAARRAVVLARMREDGLIDEPTAARAAAMPIRVRPLHSVGVRLAEGVGRHAAFLALARRPAGGTTTIDLDLQQIVEEAARAWAKGLPAGSDVAAVLIEVPTARVRALVGSADFRDPVDGQVNGATARRSPGSALKPLLYAAAFATGRLDPRTPVPDRPIERAGWRPRNFAPGFSGRIPAGEALRRSLNVPALLVTEATGLVRSVGTLRAAGLRLPADTAERGGLALATGAIEVTLADLTNAYATLARGGVHRPAILFPDEPSPARRALPENVAAAVLDELSCRRRVPEGLPEGPEGALAWFAWKTGTSSGRRDALAVGVNERYALGVWVGRFSGAGHYEYTGRTAAEPLLARLLQHPALASEGDPPAPSPLAAARPFTFEPSVREGPRILSPRDGTEARALDDGASLTFETEPPAGLAVFLDGTLLVSPPPSGARIRIPPGVHELRVVDGSGRAATATVTVR